MNCDKRKGGKREEGESHATIFVAKKEGKGKKGRRIGGKKEGGA